MLLPHILTPLDRLLIGLVLLPCPTSGTGAAQVGIPLYNLDCELFHKFAMHHISSSCELFHKDNRSTL